MNTSDDHHQPMGEGIIYKDIVPLEWCERQRDELEFSYLSVQTANEEILRFIATLDEFHIDSHEESGSSSIADLSRIEFKLNLLLDMVTQLVVREADIPESLPITLGSAGIEWIAQSAPNEGVLLELSLYLHHKYPRPFIVIGRVLSVKPVGGDGGKFQIHLNFEPMSDAVQAGLEKFIFRQHRRSIAQSRRTANALSDKSQ